MSDVIWIPPNNLRQAGYEEGYRDGVEAMLDGLRKEAVADRIGRSIGLELAEAIAIRLLKGKP